MIYFLSNPKFGNLKAILATIIALLVAPAAHAQSADPCWTPVELPSDALIELRAPAEEAAPPIAFLSPTEAGLQTLDRKSLTAAEPGETVRLASNSGQIVVRHGPLWFVRDGVAYAVPKNGPLDLRLAAQAGTRLTLSTAVKDGKLPANTEATALLDNEEPLRATLARSESLSPATPDRASSWLDAGALPITRGGRMLSVDIYAPSKTATELKSEAFQAALRRRQPSYRQCHKCSRRLRDVTSTCPGPNIQRMGKLE